MVVDGRWTLQEAIHRHKEESLKRFDELVHQITVMVEQVGGEVELFESDVDRLSGHDRYSLKIGLWPWGITFLEGNADDILENVAEVIREMRSFSLACPFCKNKYDHRDILRLHLQTRGPIDCSCSAQILISSVEDTSGGTDVHELLRDRYGHLYSDEERKILDAQGVYPDEIFSGVRYAGRVFGWKTYAVKGMVTRGAEAEDNLRQVQALREKLELVQSHQNPWLVRAFEVELPVLRWDGDAEAERCACCRDCEHCCEVARAVKKFGHYEAVLYEHICVYPFAGEGMEKSFHDFDECLENLYEDLLIDVDDIGDTVGRWFACPHFRMSESVLHEIQRRDAEIVRQERVSFPALRTVEEERQRQEREKWLLIETLGDRLDSFPSLEITQRGLSFEQLHRTKIVERPHIIYLRRAFSSILFDHAPLRSLLPGDMLAAVSFPLTHGEKAHLEVFLRETLDKLADIE